MRQSAPLFTNFRRNNNKSATTKKQKRNQQQQTEQHQAIKTTRTTTPLHAKSNLQQKHTRTGIIRQFRPAEFYCATKRNRNDNAPKRKQQELKTEQLQARKQ